MQYSKHTPDTLTRSIFIWTFLYAVAFCVASFVIKSG